MLPYELGFLVITWRTCVIICNLRLLSIDFLIIESEWADHVNIEPSCYSSVFVILDSII